MNKVKFCVVCGRRIPELSLRKRTCSEFCRARKKCGYAPYLHFKEPPFEDLTRLQQQAQAAGLSYGQYIALRDSGRLNSEGARICRS